jgi:outer membrane immunogenic protein
MDLITHTVINCATDGDEVLGSMRMRLAVLLGATCAIATVQLACAADLPTKAPALQPAPLLYNWSGFYVGGQIGYGWANIDSTSTDLFTGVVGATLSHDRNGIFGGGQVGYNFMVNPNFLIGIEGDIDAADITGTNSACSDATHCASSDGKNKWFATLRGRVGYAMNNWLIFATGGVAWVNGDTTRTITVAPAGAAVLVGQSASSSGTDTGWTAGGGVEYGFARNWSVNLEYRYMQVDTSRTFTYSLPAASRQIDSTDHINTVRLGVNYHFN